MFMFAANTGTLSGVYNAVAPEPVRNNELSKAMAKALGKPFFLPPVPAVILKLVFGKMSSVILASQRVSSRRIETLGFRHDFVNVRHAMNDLFKR
jgi:NAD dependent epimerase/dehydratase family enzyme